MNKSNLKKIIKRYSDNFDMVNDREHNEIFKWKAVKQFRRIWYGEQEKYLPFSEMFKQARAECSVLIDNSQTSPTNGVVKLAEEKAKEVEFLFREVLLSEDGNDLVKRQDNMDRFLDEMEQLRQQVFPEKWKFKQDRHSASCYLFFVRPEENYIYRYSDAEEFAKNTEFGLDLGSGENFNLENYYKMCDEIVEELKQNEELLQKHFTLIENNEEYYCDKSLHLMAFDLMYCARCYNYYDGINHISKKESLKKYTLEKLCEKEQQEMQEKIDCIIAQIRELELSIENIKMISLVGVAVQQKQYGRGIVVWQDKNKIEVQFDNCTKSFILSKKFLARPTFADDEEIIEVFTKYGESIEKIEKLEKQLKQLTN